MKYMMFMMSLINPSWCLWHANESGIFIGSNIFKLSWLAGIATTATRNQSICPSYSSWEKPVTMSINVNQCHNHSFSGTCRNCIVEYCVQFLFSPICEGLTAKWSQWNIVGHSGTKVRVTKDEATLERCSFQVFGVLDSQSTLMWLLMWLLTIADCEYFSYCCIPVQYSSIGRSLNAQYLAIPETSGAFGDPARDMTFLVNPAPIFQHPGRRDKSWASSTTVAHGRTSQNWPVPGSRRSKILVKSWWNPGL